MDMTEFFCKHVKLCKCCFDIGSYCVLIIIAQIEIVFTSNICKECLSG